VAGHFLDILSLSKPETRFYKAEEGRVREVCLPEIVTELEHLGRGEMVGRKWFGLIGKKSKLVL